MWIDKVFPKFVKTDILAIDENVMSILGFWPENIINPRSMFIIIACIFLEIIPEFWFIIKNLANVQKVFMCLHELITMIFLMVKFVVLIAKKDRLMKLIYSLKIEWKNACNEDNQQWKEISEKQEKLSYKTLKTCYTLVFGAASIYFTVPIVVFFMISDYKSTTDWPFPVQVYYGFEFNEQPLAYLLLIVPTIFLMFGIALMFYALDFLFINLLMYCTSYFRYVQSKITILKEKLMSKSIKGNDLRKEIAGIVEAHNIGIKLSEQMEDLCQVFMFMLYFVNTLTLCFLFFELNILLKDLVKLMKAFILFGMVQFLLIIFSYLGTSLSHESIRIADIIYDLPWYEMEDIKLVRSFILCIQRAQRPCKISAGKFYEINFESYSAAIQTAYSMCTILKEFL